MVCIPPLTPKKTTAHPSSLSVWCRVPMTHPSDCILTFDPIGVFLLKLSFLRHRRSVCVNYQSRVYYNVRAILFSSAPIDGWPALTTRELWAIEEGTVVSSFEGNVFLPCESSLSFEEWLVILKEWWFFILPDKSFTLYLFLVDVEAVSRYKDAINQIPKICYLLLFLKLSIYRSIF